MRRVDAWVLLGLFCLESKVSRAQDTSHRLLRYTENHVGSTRPLKNLPLGVGDLRLSLGGEARIRGEYDPNPGLGAGGEGTSVLLLRALGHADLRWRRRVRAFVQLNSLRDLRDGGSTGPLDRNALDVQQAFLELSMGLHTDRVTLRVGRQEILLGSGRLFAIRKGPNLRLSFDAARLIVRVPEGSLSLFGGAEVEPSRRAFDDDPSSTNFAWGAYATAQVCGGLGVDAYYLGTRQADVTFGGASGDETRHSLGTRWFGNAGPVDFNAEAVLQTGAIGSNRIAAWTLASDTGFTRGSGALSLRTAVRANVTSGDRNPNDDVAGTFDALYPNQTYFSDQVLLFPSNFYDLHPVLQLTWGRLFIESNWDFFFRQSERDGVYTPPGRVLLEQPSSDARFIGHQLNISAKLSLDADLELVASYSHFFAGDFVRDAGGSSSEFAAVWVEAYY